MSEDSETTQQQQQQKYVVEDRYLIQILQERNAAINAELTVLFAAIKQMQDQLQAQADIIDKLTAVAQAPVATPPEVAAVQ